MILLRLVIFLVAAFSLCACKPLPKTEDVYVSQVRVEVGKILNKDAALIDVSMPLLKQGADELDIVEVVMAVEEVFGVVIPDGELEEKGDEPIKNLNINKIAQAVAKQKKGK